MGIAKDLSTEILNLYYLYYEHKEENIREKITEKLLQKIPFGYHPYYFIEFIENPILRTHLRKDLEDLNLEKIVYDFQNFYKENQNLMKGAYLVSRFSDSIFLDYEDFQKNFFNLVREFLKLYPDFLNYSSIEKFQKIIDFLYSLKGFRGNTEDYYNPENSFINVVLESKKGNPISLSVVSLLFYEILKNIIESRTNQKLEFKISGINLPGHFILSFNSKEYTTFFDPFNFGRILTYEDCCKYLISNGFGVNIQYFFPASTLTIIRRMLRNLFNFYSYSKNSKKEKTIEYIIKNLNILIQVEEKNKF